MLLCSATIDSVLYRFSDRQLSLAHPWHRRILAFSSPTKGLTKNYGGRLDLSEGKITFSPDFYTYPPPMSFEVELRRWTTGETGDLLFNGTVYLDSYNSEGATYRLYAPAYTAEAASGTAFSSTTLNAVFTTGATALGLTVNTTGARSPSPAINYTLTRAALWTDLLASIAEWHTHIWWIDQDAGILYLRDMPTQNGEREVGREFFSPSCKYPAPTLEVMTQTSTTTYRKASTLGIGKSESVQRYHGTAANINASLQLILDTANGMETEVTLPMGNGIPAPNEKIIAVDRKVTPNLEMWCFAQNFSFDFKLDTVTISGKGGVTAL